MFIFKSHLKKFDSNLWQYHFMVPEDILEQLILDNNKRVICNLNKISWPCSLLKAQDYWFILVNNEIRKKLRLNEGDELLVGLEKDLSDYGFDMPEELSVLLEQDDEVNQYFMHLTVGKRRSLIYLVHKVKNTDSRLRKALAIAHHLKEVKGKLDYKLLYETIKVYNKKSI